MDYSNIILEMLDRIKLLEKEVANLKSKQNDIGAVATNKNNNDVSSNISKIGSSKFPITSNRRDTTRYLFDGNVYLKNRLVLAVVKAYVSKHISITRQQLKDVFQKSLQGSIGVVENVEIARVSRSDYNVRFFFTRPEDIIHLSDGDMYVCTQWGIGNIPYFVRNAVEVLGFKIEEIK